jgi:hypothetical protein
MTITFETKVWENDWELMLKSSRLEKMIERCNHAFNQKILYINNVQDYSKVALVADRLIRSGVIDQYVKVSDYAEEAMDFFSLSREKLGIGYYYSIAELVSIYLTKTEYLLHFSSDSIVSDEASSRWLSDGIETLKKNNNVKVFNLTWNREYSAAKSESECDDALNVYGFGFSDQMYLIRSTDFKKSIYEYYDPASERYPEYGGELFEKRVDSWMRQNNFLRATYKKGSYLHKNFPKNAFLKKIQMWVT